MKRAHFMIQKLVLFVFLWICLIGFNGCHEPQLPYLGKGIETDSGMAYPEINGFAFQQQDGQLFSTDSLRGKIHVASFIFLSCPTICPLMTAELKRVYQHFEHHQDVVLISFSIDPKRDQLTNLKQYAEKLGVQSSGWKFLRGRQDSVMKLADESYYAIAYPDSTSPGGFTHSGGLLLVDRYLHIRGVYDGTKPQETDRLIKDIETLEKEK